MQNRKLYTSCWGRYTRIWMPVPANQSLIIACKLSSTSQLVSLSTIPEVICKGGPHNSGCCSADSFATRQHIILINEVLMWTMSKCSNSISILLRPVFPQQSIQDKLILSRQALLFYQWALPPLPRRRDVLNQHDSLPLFDLPCWVVHWQCSSAGRWCAASARHCFAGAKACNGPSGSRASSPATLCSTRLGRAHSTLCDQRFVARWLPAPSPSPSPPVPAYRRRTTSVMVVQRATTHAWNWNMAHTSAHHLMPLSYL